jgi:hypothetical protein
MHDVENYVGRRNELAAKLVKIDWFQGVTLDGEPQSYATAHNLLEIEESCKKIMALVAQLGSAESPNAADQVISDAREELRHIHFHIADDRFFRTVL